MNGTASMNGMGRVITAMVTPFDGDGAVDATGAGRLARRLVDSGSDGILVAGTTGESPTLKSDEKLELLAGVLDQVGGDAFVWMGTGSNSTAATVRLTERAERAGANGVMVVAPYYNRPSQAGLYAHFRTVARATSLPVMVYNVPGRTSVNLGAGTFASLAEDAPNILAIKEASGDLDQVSEIGRLTEGLEPAPAIYSGDDNLTLPILAVGGRGVVSVASHLVGTRIRAMIDAFLAGRTSAALEIHRSLLDIFRVLFITTNPVPVKTALRLMGFDVGGFRLPLVEASDRERELISRALETLGLTGPGAG